ncbi:MAG: hypothetical protein KKC76_08390 [Proteobacteria bacterium]|nr:hypothetical protein [Pseudomonadota bacterium]MBU4297486.1 hypothetical protein [Pseudomonadota bacterium]MCG2749256.1 hypothetical protein [Desulfobulbaceae bacterium]
MLKRSLVNVALALALAVSWPLMAAAADHTGMEGMVGRTKVPHKKTSSLDAQTVDGIKASAQLNDVREAMAKAGKEETHHLLVFFTDQAGAAIKSDVVAVKVTSPDGIEGQALPLHGMGMHYGVDLKLAQPGTYHFAVGTQFSDGKKRQFVFSSPVK